MVNRRRVQLTGTSTLSVSLPKNWAKRYFIKKGSELAVIEAGDGSLVIRQEGDEPKKTAAEIVCEDYSSTEEMRRRFLALYLAGYSAIKVSSKQRLPMDRRKMVVDEARRLIGV